MTGIQILTLMNAGGLILLSLFFLKFLREYRKQ